ncbi:MAG: lipoate--protein ligase family protein [Deltaproteobacteria bacterium]|nr:lipoate--protein ligase family protein [Deltaproteobacteria bacterium]
MQLYRLGKVTWQDSQLAYHALAYLGREGLILCSPAEPYVSVGYFQDPAQELDLEHCRRQGLPIFRREVGGGAVYLDQNQVFWQVVLRRDHPLVSLNREVFYRRFLAPVVGVYRALGVGAGVAPINDVAVERRRIAGTGAGEIGDCVVFVGNLMRRFDCAAMARALRAPDPEFRRSYQKYMENELTTLRQELGQQREAALSDEQLYDLLASEFASVMGGLEPRGIDDELRQSMERLGKRMLSPEWTYHSRKPRPHRKVKVRAGLYLHHWQQEAPQGMVEARFTSLDGKVLEVSLGEGTGKSALPKVADYIGHRVESLTKALSEVVQAKP